MKKRVFGILFSMVFILCLSLSSNIKTAEAWLGLGKQSTKSCWKTVMRFSPAEEDFYYESVAGTNRDCTGWWSYCEWDAGCQ